jgi:hypothetical protein
LETQHAFDQTSGYGCGLYKELDDSRFSILGRDAGMGCDSLYYMKEALVVNVMCNRSEGQDRMIRLVLENIER